MGAQRSCCGVSCPVRARRTVAAMPLQAAAGERFAYNQTNYGLLARIVDDPALSDDILTQARRALGAC